MARRVRPPKQQPLSRRRWSGSKFTSILEARFKSGLTYLDIMYATKVRSMGTIYNWKANRSQPDVDRFFALVEVLGVKDADLLEEY
jgi:transcriptional regulator with XRE-family HTH domain